MVRARHSVRAVVVNQNAFVSMRRRAEDCPPYQSPPFEFENWAVIALGGIGVAASRQSAAI